MRAEIRSITSYDVQDPATWRPKSAGWSLGVVMRIGPKHEEGEESFHLEVCDPRWIAERVRRERIIDGRHLLVVEEFQWPTIVGFLEKRVSAYEVDSWNGLAERLSRLGHWEFEGD